MCTDVQFAQVVPVSSLDSLIKYIHYLILFSIYHLVYLNSDFLFFIPHKPLSLVTPLSQAKHSYAKEREELSRALVECQMQARLRALSWVLGSQECVWSLAVATKGHAPEGCPQDLLHQYSPFEVGLCLGKDTPGYHPVLVPKYLAVASGPWHERLDQMQRSFHFSAGFV